MFSAILTVLGMAGACIVALLIVALFALIFGAGAALFTVIGFALKNVILVTACIVLIIIVKRWSENNKH